MLKRTIVIPVLVFIGVLVALICLSINGYGTIVILGSIAAGFTWMAMKLPEWMAQKEQTIAGLESWQRMRLIASQLEVVNKRLKDALERSAMISLEFEYASNQADQPVLNGLKNAAPQMKIMDLFRHEQVNERLLILGHPGAGKTTMLLELARELLVEAQGAGAKRIPHVFEMSRWEEGLDLVEYLALELKRAHNLDLEVGREMAASGDLLPLLDGLDELGDPRVVAAAMGAIDKYLAWRDLRGAVVCCRVLDYELANEQLWELNGAIELQPLSEVAIRNYLTAVGKENLWNLVEQNPALVRSDDPNILPLLKTPLFLSVFAVASPIVAVKSEGELWDAYIVKQLGIPAEMLSGKGYKRYEGREEPTQKQTKNYLIFLAKQLEKTTEVMLIEEMQPTWLRSEPKVLGRSVQQWLYRLILGLFYSLVIGLVIGLWFGLALSPVYGLRGGLIFGPIIGLLGSLLGKLGSIEPTEELQLSARAWLSIKILNPSITLNPFIILSQNKLLLFFLIFSLILGKIAELILSLISSLTFFLIWGFVQVAKTELKIGSEPNQGIKALVKNMAILMPIGLILWGLVQLKLMPYLQEYLTPTQFKNISGAIAALIAIIIVFFSGGFAFIQHVSLRITLYLSHQKSNVSQTRCIPWNYARFLSYAADRKLLQQTGGAYRFIHRSLLEHFAEMEN